MRQPGLHRDYFFEFAGMPQSGKSTLEDIVAHFLKREGYIIEEFQGGSRHSPLRFSSIADLNVWLASKISGFVIGAVGREAATHKIFLLDRGLIDRCMFTDTLLREGKIDENTTSATKAFLTSPRLLQNIDGVFVFVTTPNLAIMRENENKLVESEGGVMNKAFLTTMRSTIESDIEWVKKLMSGKHVQLIDTSQFDGEVLATARDIADTILHIVHKPASKNISR